MVYNVLLTRDRYFLDTSSWIVFFSAENLPTIKYAIINKLSCSTLEDRSVTLTAKCFCGKKFCTRGCMISSHIEFSKKILHSEITFSIKYVFDFLRAPFWIFTYSWCVGEIIFRFVTKREMLLVPLHMCILCWMCL